MKIKNIREPNEEEKNSIIPKLILFGVVTAIITLAIYFLDFHFMEIGESMYLKDKIISSNFAAEHDILIKLFEAVYGRDYMTNKFEGLTISAIASIVGETAIGLFVKITKPFGR